MKFKVSKFLTSMIVGSCLISNFNGYVLGMETENQSEKAKRNELSKELSKTMANDFDCDVFVNIFDCFKCVISDDPTNYSFYKPGMTLGGLLDGIKDWMKDPNLYTELTNSPRPEYVFAKFHKSKLARLSETCEQKKNSFIDLFFEQISANVPKHTQATKDTIVESFKYLDGLDEQLALDRQKIREQNKI